MPTKIIIDPVTRISGFLDISLEVDNNIVTNAKTGGMLFRGFEKMLIGRAPEDAIFFTERICGICSTSHAIASSMALQNTYDLVIEENDLYLRDLIHGFEILQNHIRQFYFFTVPDYVRLENLNPFTPQLDVDYRLNAAATTKINNSHIGSAEISRLAHEGLATIGGKAPHNHGIAVGGVTVDLDSRKLVRVKSIINEIKGFVNGNMVEDIGMISQYYSDYFKMGVSYENYISYGLFNGYKEIGLRYANPGVMFEGHKYDLDANLISEGIEHSWYVDGQKDNEIEPKKPGAYSFIKAPRYNGHPMQGGPLARLRLNGVYKGGDSCMDRNLARVIETQLIISKMEMLVDRVELRKGNRVKYLDIKDGTGNGVGLVDTIRGALGHWARIENGKIAGYNIITPTGWNLSPTDSKGVHGPTEKALLGTRVHGEAEDGSTGRIVRSFDPCVSCATH